MKRILAWPISPLLFGIYPIIHIYSNNLGSVDLSIIVPPLIAAVAVILALNAISAFWMRDWRKGALIIDVILFSSYLWTCFIDTACPWIYGTSISKFLAVSVIAIILFLVRQLGMKLRHSTVIYEFTCIANLAVVFLLVTPVTQIILHELTSASSMRVASAVRRERKLSSHPDVYYMILDGYAREDILKNDLGYDNASFINNLRRKGFFVASKSRSNYAYTFLSLASSLNMDYIGELNQAEDQEYECILRITNNSVAQLFRMHGYQIIHYAPMWVGANVDPYSKNTFNPARIEEFETLILKRFLIRPFLKRGLADIFRARTLFTLQHLEELPSDPRPKFVFAHILSPHPPYVFDRNGNMPESRAFPGAPPGSNDWYPKERYTDQIDYLNHLVLNTVETILKESKTPPIIIIQGDHGAACDGTSKNPSPLMARERMSILNAYYVPISLRKKLYSTISPVNSFRVIGNYLFHAQFSRLPDKNYYSGPMGVTPYTFIDVTTFLPKAENKLGS